jgi:ankyrin repeat protein
LTNDTLHLALEEGDDDVAEQLLELGADASVPYADFGGMMPLHYFCSIGRVRTVKLLLAKGGASSFVSVSSVLPRLYKHMSIRSCAFDSPPPPALRSVALRLPSRTRP